MDNMKEVKIDIVDDQFVVDSREVALNFGKRHDNVLRDIENIQKMSSILRRCLLKAICQTAFRESMKQRIRQYQPEICMKNCTLKRHSKNGLIECANTVLKSLKTFGQKCPKVQAVDRQQNMIFLSIWQSRSA